MKEEGAALTAQIVCSGLSICVEMAGQKLDLLDPVGRGLLACGIRSRDSILDALGI